MRQSWRGVGTGRFAGNTTHFAFFFFFLSLDMANPALNLVMSRSVGAERKRGLHLEFPAGSVYHSCQQSPETHGKTKLNVPMSAVKKNIRRWETFQS